MKVLLNGRPVELAPGTTLLELIQERGLNPDSLVVQRNLEVLPRERWAGTALLNDDQIELIKFVGGG